MGKVKGYAMEQEEMVYEELCKSASSYQFFEKFQPTVFKQYANIHVTDKDYVGQVADQIWSDAGKDF